MNETRDHRGRRGRNQGSIPPSGPGADTPGGFTGARDHRGEPANPTVPRANVSETSGGVAVTDTADKPDLGKGAGGD